MQGDIGEVDATDLHALHQLTAEVQTRCRGCDSTLVLGIDSLEEFHILRHGRPTVDDIPRQRGST